MPDISSHPVKDLQGKGNTPSSGSINGTANGGGKAARKAEKAARRQAKVAEQGKQNQRPAAENISAPSTSGLAKAGRQKHEGPVSSAGSSGLSSLEQSGKDTPRGELDKRVSMFKHLDRTKRSGTADASRDIHPAVLSLTLRFASYSILGSSARCTATLRAFQTVIRDYRTPAGTSLSRNLQSHLSKQIDFLKSARPLSVSMGNAIRWLKQQISIVPIDLSDSQARDGLVTKIDNFLRDKIEVADRVITDSAVQLIGHGDVVLTYARSSVVEKVFLEAHLRGIDFKVIVVDSRPFFEGKELVRELATAGIRCEYILISGLSYVMNDATTVFLGAHSVTSNGHLFSRVGSALVAMSAKWKNVPVIVCCECLKFSNDVQLDSVTFNELGVPDDLVNVSNNLSEPTLGPLKNWRAQPNLKLLNVLYDLTPPENINKIVTEVGSLPPSSVPVILREYS
ncbi:uncharacterized protein V1516DRAFT_668878 [Lipomyces oligophaga]|uniref:uncharacterized protein n=1 Tax=Lipomyces oligophaga TaxID=45792 RepID=UPI0034D007E6